MPLHYHTVTQTSLPPKSPSSTDSTPIITDLLIPGDDVTRTSQGEFPLNLSSIPTQIATTNSEVDVTKNDGLTDKEVDTTQALGNLFNPSRKPLEANVLDFTKISKPTVCVRKLSSCRNTPCFVSESTSFKHRVNNSNVIIPSYIITLRSIFRHWNHLMSFECPHSICLCQLLSEVSQQFNVHMCIHLQC